jgi:outer membrane protein TolC
VDREAKLIAAGRKFQETAIKLSLFFRDAEGLPALPDPAQLPHEFPLPQPATADGLPRDVQLAIQFRPELRELALKRQSVSVELSLAQNQTLPQLDSYMKVAKDLGTETPPIDKTPFQLESGLIGSVPLERSVAIGSARAAQASLAQVNAKTRWYQDKITAEVQDAVSALIATYSQLRPRREAVQLTYRMELAERRKYELGDSNLFVLNLRELDTRDAAALEVDALLAYFAATADYHAALGLDGLRIRSAARNP